MEENKVMEMMENNDVVENFDDTEVVETERGGNGAVVIGLALAAGALGATVVKKIRDKKAAKKPRKKKKLMWVEIDEEPVEPETDSNEESEKEE